MSKGADNPSEEDLLFSMPEFKVPESEAEEQVDLAPTNILSAEASEAIHQDFSEEKHDELVFDREELVRTRNMSAFSRKEISAITLDGWLKDQRYAPDILVSPPRVLTKKWQDGTGNPSNKTEDRSSIANTQKVEVRQIEADVPEADVPEVELDPNEVELVEPPVRPPPRPANPAPRAQPPSPQPSNDVNPEKELDGIVQELLDEKKPKVEHHPTAEDDKRSGWCNTLFDEEYLRTLPNDLNTETEREVQFIKASLGLKSGARVLDLACGFGRHAVELAQDGFEVAGLDLSIDLLQHALTQAKKRNLSIKFIHGDMRELNFSEIFDAAYCWQTSFGYFNDRTNVRVLEGLNRSLKMGGRLLIDTVNRDYVVAQMPTRTWWEGIECVFLEEVEFDFNTSILHTKRSFIYDGAPPREYSSFIRLYGLHEFKRILGYCGFRVLEVSGEIHHRGAYLGPASRRSILLAEKIAPVQ